MKRLLAGLLAALFALAPIASKAQSATAAGTIVGSSSCVIANSLRPGTSTATVTVSGTFVGTITVSGIGGDGATTRTLGSTITTTGTFAYPVGSFTAVEACFTSYTSGSAFVSILGTNAPTTITPPLTWDSISCGTTACSSPTAISTSTTTLVVTGVTGASIYVFFAGFQASGTNSAMTFLYKAGTGATCGTNTIYPFAPVATTSLAPVLGEVGWIYGGGPWTAITTYSAVPAAEPMKLPEGFSLCLTTASTTTALYALVYYAIR